MKKKLLALIVAVVATMSIGMTAFAKPAEPQCGELQVGEFTMLSTPEQLTAQNYNVLVSCANYDASITKIEYNLPELGNKWEVLGTADKNQWFTEIAINNDYLPEGLSQIQYRVTVFDPTALKNNVHTNMYSLNFADRSIVYHDFGEAFNFSQVLGTYTNGNYFIDCGEVNPEYFGEY